MVRLKDVDEAQQIIVNQTKELVQSGQIVISSGGEEEAMIE
jgi:flagellar motor switch protein FliG